MYQFLKEKAKNIIRHNSAESFCEDIVSSIFEYDNFPVKNKQFTESIAMILGKTAVFEYDGEYVVGVGERTGGYLNENGMLSDLTVFLKNGFSKTFIDFENPDSPDYDKVALISNNRWETPDDFYMQYADLLAEIDKSIMHIIGNSRSAPLAVCSDKNASDVVEEAFKNSDAGEIRTVIVKNPFEESKPVEILPLNAVENSALIQYLYKAKDDTLRQFYQHYGICGSGEAKMAQLTEAEVEKGSNSHLILVTEMLKNRQRCVEIMNKKFGWNTTVRFSTCWQREEAHHEVEEEVRENEEVLQSGEPSGENSTESGSESAE